MFKVYRPDVKAPHLDKDKVSFLKYVGGDRWEIQSDGQTVANYSTNDLRISIVYRAKCFHSKEEADRYNSFYDTPSNIMSLEGILNTLKADLVTTKGVRKEDLETISNLDLALLLMKKYIQYPSPSLKDTWFPLNYCALPLLFPWTKSFVEYFCR